MTAMEAAVIIIALQGLVVALLIFVIRGFRAYTRAVVEAQRQNAATHRSTEVLYQQSIKILEYATSLMKEPAGI